LSGATVEVAERALYDKIRDGAIPQTELLWRPELLVGHRLDRAPG